LPGRSGLRARSRKPPYARDLAAGSANAANRFGRGLDYNRHVKSIGVHEAVSITRNRHMAGPKDEIAARKIGRGAFDWRPERAFLHVAVARASDPAGRKRELH
jgi:hypothetical protein